MTESKASNPKDALGIKKVPFHAIPAKPLMELGLAMMEGGRKYGTHNYRAVGVRFSTYYDSTLRHVISWWEGEDNDSDSGVHHIVKAIAGLFVVRDSMHMGNFEDDRPLQYPNGIDMIKFNRMAAEIIEQYPNCVAPFLQIKEIIETQGLKQVVAAEEIREGQAVQYTDDKKDEVEPVENVQYSKNFEGHTTYCAVRNCLLLSEHYNEQRNRSFCDEHHDLIVKGQKND
jgi:hypothetical protein